MSIKQNAALIGLITAFVFVSGCKRGFQEGPPPGHSYGLQNPREFRIYIYTDQTPPPPSPGQTPPCLVDWPQVTLWRNHNHTITWVSDDGKAYTVDFSSLGHNNSPFSQGTFSVPAGGEISSKAITRGPGYYDYGIRDATNQQVCKPASDPGVYIK